MDAREQERAKRRRRARIIGAVDRALVRLELQLQWVRRVLASHLRGRL